MDNNISKRQNSLTSSMSNNKSSIDKNKNFNEAFYFLKTLKLTDAIDYIEKKDISINNITSNHNDFFSKDITRGATKLAVILIIEDFIIKKVDFNLFFDIHTKEKIISIYNFNYIKFCNYINKIELNIFNLNSTNINFLSKLNKNYLNTISLSINHQCNSIKIIAGTTHYTNIIEINYYNKLLFNYIDCIKENKTYKKYNKIYFEYRSLLYNKNKQF